MNTTLDSHWRALRANTSPGVEKLWAFARISLAVAITFGSFLLLRGQPIYPIYLGIMAFVFVYGCAMLYFLSKKKAFQAFVSGFVLDNIVTVTAWYLFGYFAQNSVQTNDMYLAVLPLILLGVVRLGWFLGVFYAAFWIGWFIWYSLYFYAPTSYDIHQLPVRVVFITLTTVVVIRLMAVIQKERSLEKARLRELEQLERLKSDLLLATSHEIKTPLTALKVGIQILADFYHRLTEEQRRSTFRVLNRGVERLERITEQSLNYSQAINRRDLSARRETSIGELAQSIITLVTLNISTKEQELEVSIDQNLPRLFVDPGQIEQVYLNLLDNANKYTPPGGHIKLLICQQDSRIYSEVASDGPRIPEEDLQHLFTEYYRGSKADRLGVKGMGLGLAMSKRLIELHGGTIGVESTREKGNVFYFTIPLNGKANPDTSGLA